MVLCENSVFEKKKRNLIELDIIKTRGDGAIGIKLFLTFFHQQIEAGALGFAHIYKAGAERVNQIPIFLLALSQKVKYSKVNQIQAPADITPGSSPVVSAVSPL